VPSAWSEPPNQPTNDHADGATLGRWDAKASQRPRRPEMKEPYGGETHHTDRGGGNAGTHRAAQKAGVEEWLAGGMLRITKTSHHHAGQTPAPQQLKVFWCDVVVRASRAQADLERRWTILRARRPHHNRRLRDRIRGRSRIRSRDRDQLP